MVQPQENHSLLVEAMPLICNRRRIFGVMVLRSKVRADSGSRLLHPLADPRLDRLAELAVQELKDKMMKTGAVVNDPETVMHAVTLPLKTARHQCRQNGEVELFGWSAWHKR